MIESELLLNSSIFIFRRNDKDWCNILLKNGESIIELGADSFSVVKVKLMNALTSSCASTEPECILSLFEKHHTLYRQLVDDSVELFLENGEGNEIWRSKICIPVSEDALGSLN